MKNSYSEEFYFEEMDSDLKGRILRNISSSKTEEEIEKGRKAAEKLMKISRQAMIEGKLPSQKENITFEDYQVINKFSIFNQIS